MNNLIKSAILNTDSYKASHYVQYPPNTEYVFSYIESRGGIYESSMFIGIQYLLKEYLSVRITRRDIEFAAKVWAAHGEPFNREGWEYILEEHGGKLPLRIRALKEGTVVPTRNALVTVENTDPKCYWLTSYIETMLLRLWYPITVATQSFEIKQIIKKFMNDTSVDHTGIDFMLHDFGARGVSSFESAAIGDMAHLANWKGTDTITGALAAVEYYGYDLEDFTPSKMVAWSVPAGEHSSITSWGQAHEVDAYENMIKQFGGEGKIFSVVSDSYDIFNAVENIWGKQLREKVLESGARLVVRPDSGDPATVVLRCVQALERTFGAAKNEKGFLVLNPAVRVLQGDGIDKMTIHSILTTLMIYGYSAENVVFGMGGKLLQALDRDTMKFAMKASAARINGVWVDVFKDPITDPGKKSKKGRIETFKNFVTGEVATLRLDEVDYDEWAPLMETVYKDGEVLINYTFDEVRANATRALEEALA